MRVIAGSAKGIPLQPVPGSGTRPVADRVKEALFDILGDTVRDARVLDLFAGTGGIGIEALSRGANEAVFVENQHRAAATIRSNLERTRLSSRARIVQADVFKFLAGPTLPFDLIYVAPPQYRGLWKQALLALEAHPGWMGTAAQVVVQVFPKEFEPLPLAHLALADQRRYGSTLLSFFEPLS